MKSRNGRAKARVIGFSALLGSASLIALNSTGTALAQNQVAVAAPPEQVLVTGSLIRGEAPVGVPVTNLSQQEFLETGQLKLADTLKSVPALQIYAEESPTFGGGTLSFELNVQIHGLGTGSGVETLLLIDGLRWPPQNYSNDTVNPSIIPQIAIQRVDVLTAGASAVYGSDATAGVINVILRRGFDGAISQASIGTSTGTGYLTGQASQLFGRSWDTGNITVSYSFTDSSNLSASARPYYTLNFAPHGLMDFTPIGASMPGIVTTGKAKTIANAPAGETASNGTRFCANCFSVPAGTGWNYGDTAAHTNPTAPGSAPTVSWATLLANPGVNNEIDPWWYADARPQLQTTAATGTLDQKLTNDFYGIGPVSLFADAFWSNQRGRQIYPSGNGEARQEQETNLAVPTTNPYYPSGAPAGLDVNYSFAAEVPTIVTGGEVAGHFDFGLNLDEMPFKWHGKLTYSLSDDKNYGNVNDAINKNNLNAALGNTITDSSGALAPYTKPSNIPYLNVFCDPRVFTCNSPATLAYITGYRYQPEEWIIQENQVNFDGPLFDIPGGTILGSINAQTLSEHYHYANIQNDNTISTSVITDAEDHEYQSSYAFFGQLDIPIFGNSFTLPLVQSFVVQLGYRYDKYNYLPNPVYTPKVAANWNLGGGLTLRGAWGKSFRVPSFAEGSPQQSTISGVNPLGLAAANDVAILGCGSVIGSPAGVAIPGSLTALLNPTCSSNPALRQPGVLDVSGSGNGAATILRGGQVLGPQTLKQWSTGLNFTPTGRIFGVDLTGLDIDVTWFNLEFFGLISTNTLGLGPDDPVSRSRYTVIPNPNAPITDPSNSSFFALVQQLAGYPSRGGNFDPAAIPNIKVISDSALTNIGTRIFEGSDFSFRYDYALGDLGSLNIGAAGFYEINDKSQAGPGSPVVSVFQGQNSGNRLQRVRYRLGWQNDTWSVTGFANYFGHGAVNVNGDNLIPPCFYAPGSGPGSCYAGSPYYGPYTTYPNRSPAQVYFDLAIGYQTGEQPANPFLRNIGLELTINDILDRPPPFQVGARGSGSIRAFDNNFSDLQRLITLTVTKRW
ncbi:MAG TPA: TonB-dependent receptor [Micropepsaceae bacterium]|nr:TonB-dependent receptor [Micropepsaceae bacterium]